MSNSSPAPASRLARSAQIATMVPAGNSTPRYSRASVQIRAVNGVIGSNLSTSSTAAGTRPGSRASAAHCAGWAANSRIAWDSWAWVVSIPPATTLRTRLTHSSWVSRTPSSSAASSVLMRSSEGSRRRRSSSISTYSYNSPTARSIRAGSLARARMSNCFWTQPDHSCSRGASCGGAPSTAAMVSEGYGLANVATKSHAPQPPGGTSPRSCHSRSRNPRIAGRHRSAARGVNAGPIKARSRRCRSPVAFRMLASICSRRRPPVTPKISAISRPGKAVCRARRKNSPDSRSSTTYVSGLRASQPCCRTAASRSWYTSPPSPGSV